jgi:hypothetical protein
LKLYQQPIEGYENKSLITAERAYFLPYLDRVEAPRFLEILSIIFDLDDPEIYREIDGKLFGGRIILGYFDTSTKEIDVHVPLETSEYVKKRTKEVFGDI